MLTFRYKIINFHLQKATRGALSGGGEGAPTAANIRRNNQTCPKAMLKQMLFTKKYIPIFG